MEIQDDESGDPAMNTVFKIPPTNCEWKKTPQWISVKDGLPAPMKNVLVSCGEAGMAVAYLGYKTGQWLETITEQYIPFEVTHWMPLPDPPKGER